MKEPKPPSRTNEVIEKAYKFIEVVGAKNSSEVIQKRLERLFDAVPQLKSDYVSAVRIELGADATEMNVEDFSIVCNRISIRLESLTVYEDWYFEENFSEIVDIIKQRKRTKITE